MLSSPARDLVPPRAGALSMEMGRTGSELGAGTASVEKVHATVDSLGIREQTTTQAGQAS